MFEPADFKKLVFPVYEIDPKDDLRIKLKPLGLERAIPTFYEYEEKDRNAVLRYIFYMYDPNSPFHQIKRIEDRKAEAAALAGLDIEKKKMRVLEIWGCMDKVMVDMIIEFAKHYDNKTFTMKSINEEVFYQYASTLMDPITNYKTDKDALQALEVKSKLMIESDKILARLEEYDKKIYGGDKDLETAVKKKRTTTPETMAKK